MLSRKAIDGIGGRLRDDAADVAAFAELAIYRDQVAQVTQDALGLVMAQTTSVVSGRSGKSTRSIVEKLRRQPTLKLSQMQDIEGCRVIVDSKIEQDSLASRLCAAFDDVAVHDRRTAPSHGYALCI